jgi:hypothetical protein
MMRAWSWEAPRSWPSRNCSRPSTRAPAVAGARVAALPSAPNPTTIASRVTPRALERRSGIDVAFTGAAASSVEAAPGHLVGVEQQLADHRGGAGPVRPEGERGHVVADRLSIRLG